MKLRYADVKELGKLIEKARQDIWISKSIDNKLMQLYWFSGEYHMRFVDYQYQWMKLCNLPNTQVLDEVVETLRKLIQCKSKLADFAELESDVNWLQKYYQDKSWCDVTRWLTNINSTLRETFFQYIETIKKVRSQN